MVLIYGLKRRCAGIVASTASRRQAAKNFFFFLAKIGRILCMGLNKIKYDTLGIGKK